jgi:formyltetrahydrofolate deformylase
MDLIASLQCADQPGIVHAMTSAVLNCGGNIIENQQFTDTTTNTFVMRTRFETSQGLAAAQTVLTTVSASSHLHFIFAQQRRSLAH